MEKLKITLKNLYRTYPKKFWMLIGALFIDRVGGALIFPFLSLYMTEKFGVGMVQVGALLAVHSGSAFFGNMLGGALADKFGRKSMLILGLILSASISLGMGFIERWEVFYFLAFLTGFVSEIGHPAAQAMMTDILPSHQRVEGFGVLRVAMNLAVTFGPAIGGVLAGISYLLLFILDCVISTITAVIVYFSLEETKPEKLPNEKEENMLQSIGGYGRILKDKIFIAFLFLTTLTAIVYMQMNATLGVFLRDMHAISSQQFGFILSLNATLVVLFQFLISRQVKKFHPLHVMMAGNLFYAIGFSMYGYTSQYWQFLAAMAIITIGEMINAPIVQSLIANIAPKDMRGRYMAAFQNTYGIAIAIGPLLAGIVMDTHNPNWVWWGGGIILLIVIMGYIVLKSKVGERIHAINNANQM